MTCAVPVTKKSTSLTSRYNEGVNDLNWSKRQDKAISSGRALNDTKEISGMLYEAIAKGNEKWQLPISSVCGADCVFCCLKYNPMDMNLKSGFRDLEDIKQAICLLDGKQTIQLGGESNGVVRQEGEALLHPKIFEILRLIRAMHPTCPIWIQTNATQLTEKFLQKMTEFMPIDFQISYHSNNQHNWCKIFGIKAKKFIIAQNAWPLLYQYGFTAQPSLVTMPNLVGYDDVENTIKYLSQFVSVICVWSPHYTDATPPYETFRHEMSYDPNEMSEFMTKMRSKYNIDIDWPLDPNKPINTGGYHSEFMPATIMEKLFKQGRKNPLWLFSEAAWIRGAGKLIEQSQPFFANQHTAVSVKNTTYGGTITCAGLLMVDDYDKSIEKTFEEYPQLKYKVDSFVVPGLPFNKFGEDMLGKRYSALQEKYDIPVNVVMMVTDEGHQIKNFDRFY